MDNDPLLISVYAIYPSFLLGVWNQNLFLLLAKVSFHAHRLTIPPLCKNDQTSVTVSLKYSVGLLERSLNGQNIYFANDKQPFSNHIKKKNFFL